MGNPDAVKNAISDRINRLYNDGRAFPAWTATMPCVDSEPSPQLWSNQVTNMTLLSIDSAPSPSLNQDVWDWTVRIEYKMYELRTSFYVFIFLGEVPENSQDWHTSPSHVGSACAFVNKAAKHCANCTNHEDIVLEEFVHLDQGIARLSGLGSLQPHAIEPYLKDALKWRVKKVFVHFFIMFANACS